MAGSVAAQSRDFARHFFQMVEQLGRDEWISASDAFKQTIAAHRDHPYVAYLAVNRARKAGFSATAERVREAEFPRIERRKTGTRRNAPVFYRVWQFDRAFTLNLPYRMPQGHPLREAADAPTGHALRRDPSEQKPRSPWRRRQNGRRASAGAPSPGPWRNRLASCAASLLDTVKRAIARRKP
jgi:hypothetical protein